MAWIWQTGTGEGKQAENPPDSNHTIPIGKACIVYCLSPECASFFEKKLEIPFGTASSGAKQWVLPGPLSNGPDVTICCCAAVGRKTLRTLYKGPFEKRINVLYSLLLILLFPEE